jgi:uncharacterized protein YidB (DUF937 family)
MRGVTLKRAALSIGGAAILLLAGTSLGAAQSAPSPTPSPNTATKQAIIDDAAAKLGLTGDQLRQALSEARKELGAKTGVHLDRRHALDVAAKTLGLPDAAALRKQLGGTTLEAVAQQHGVQPATVAAAIVADLDQQIDAQVAAGTLKPARAATLKQKLSTKVDAFMTHQFKVPGGAS